MPRSAWLVAMCVVGFMAGAEATGDDGLLQPKLLNQRAPDLFHVEVATSEGKFVVEIERAWAPVGADRFYNLALSGFYDETRFFRVVPGFAALFGMHGDPKISEVWNRAEIRDDPVRRPNERGTLTFAMAGPNTRTTQIFINLKDNRQLDGMGFAPFGHVIRGWSVIENLCDEYGDRPPRGKGPHQHMIRVEGNAYLKREYPELDFVIGMTVFVPPSAEAPRPPNE
ncbi:MAG: peptidylprolyl isomerase [bacterium]|nr:peptidylprolyl isomerase [bacterium]